MGCCILRENRQRNFIENFEEDFGPAGITMPVDIMNGLVGATYATTVDYTSSGILTTTSLYDPYTSTPTTSFNDDSALQGVITSPNLPRITGISLFSTEFDNSCRGFELLYNGITATQYQYYDANMASCGYNDIALTNTQYIKDVQVA